MIDGVHGCGGPPFWPGLHDRRVDACARGSFAADHRPPHPLPIAFADFLEKTNAERPDVALPVRPDANAIAFPAYLKKLNAEQTIPALRPAPRRAGAAPVKDPAGPRWPRIGDVSTITPIRMTRAVRVHYQIHMPTRLGAVLDLIV